MKWHDEDGNVKWSKVMWTYYFIVIIPLLVVGNMVPEYMREPLGLIRLILLLPFLGMMVWDFALFRRKMKREDRYFNEQMQIMRHWGPETPKKLEELKERYNKK